jgi:hypothetical protein
MVSAWKVNPYTRWQAADHRNLAYDRLASQVAELAEYTILDGPYKGMKYFGPSGVPIVDRRPTTKFIGSFEEELHPWIESLISSGVNKVVHIGASEGYHAVGMAMRMPESTSIVFDTLIPSRKACKELAKQNHVHDRIQLRGFCGTEGMLDIDLTSSLVFSDCGGAELTILDPALYPHLRKATILVETHDAFDERVTPRLRSRFSSTHRIETRSAVERDPRGYSFLNAFPSSMGYMAVDEKRARTREGRPQTWALLRPYAS